MGTSTLVATRALPIMAAALASGQPDNAAGRVATAVATTLGPLLPGDSTGNRDGGRFTKASLVGLLVFGHPTGIRSWELYRGRGKDVFGATGGREGWSVRPFSVTSTVASGYTAIASARLSLKVGRKWSIRLKPVPN